MLIDVVATIFEIPKSPILTNFLEVIKKMSLQNSVENFLLEDILIPIAV